MTAEQNNREVRDNSDKSRFEIVVDDQVGGILDYELGTDMITLTHTEVDDSFSGQGLGKAIVRGALEQARTRGLSVRPVCPLVVKVIKEDTENDFLDLVRLSDREEFGLPA